MLIRDLVRKTTLQILKSKSGGFILDTYVKFVVPQNTSRVCGKNSGTIMRNETRDNE